MRKFNRSYDEEICKICANLTCSNKKTGMKVPNVTNKIIITLEMMDDCVRKTANCSGFKKPKQ